MSESLTSETTRAAVESATVCVVGLGYVGVPLSLGFDEEGLDVVGFDIDRDKVEKLASGDDVTGDHGDEVVAASEIEFTANPAHISQADYVILTVPTPVDDTKNPNLDFIEAASRTVGEYMSEGATVVLESTVYPGVTREVLGPVIEEASGLEMGSGFNLGYSPERLSPGVEGRGLRDVVKIVSGDTDETLAELAALYGLVVDAGVYRAPSIETAEAAKVIENVQRDVNIALVNELAIVCDHLGLETEEVLDAAGSKWNFHDYRPGLVGGHCIPVDPLYLAHGSQRAGYSPDLILTGREVNEYMPKHAAELALRALNDSGRVMKDSRLLILGLAYKANVGDIRTSEVSGVIRELETYGVEVAGYDPHADDEAMAESFGIDIQGERRFEGFDGVLVATAHDEFGDLDLGAVADELNDDPVLVDVAGQFDGESAAEHGFRYECL
ncbi:nucleotide sugar dehydrogenase (plasmid) [Halorarum halophilum]|uniref:UDP-N-acetyl-D-mannosamine dehydrogenase n=1 Tax=Halorarum halophilum TaxID=2743090 RepID=A0A7D5GP59_9EURY|nr:nucleotide sugar dehydrogenase [Halobaculum halophilum]QLG29747.1 nucleotide sugar dehydrogenase [Halobaculum halophilum]